MLTQFQAADLRRLRARRARRSLAEFIRQGWHVLEPGSPLLWNWHIDAIAMHIQALFEDWMQRQRDPSFRQRYQNLLINVPPGTAKSRIASVFAPAWMWVHWPNWRAIYLSANPRVAIRDSMYCRFVLESEWYRQSFRPAWKLADDQNAKSLYYNTAGGFRAAFGITANIVGDRADHIGVDDPNDAYEVNSDVIRKAVNDHWDVAISNRTNDLRCSTRCGIMQRLHEEDWSGHVLEHGGWEHLCLPMEYEPERHEPGAKDYIPPVTSIGWRDPRKERGEVLHPERFPDSVLATETRRLGSYGAAGQLAQRPSPEEGGRFKRAHWRFWKPDGVASEWTTPRPKGCWDGPARPLPPLVTEIISVDAAFIGTESSDPVVFTAWGTSGADRFLLDRWRGQWGFTETCERFSAFCARRPRAYRKIIENKANGPAIIDALRSKVAGLVPVEPMGGKQARAWAIQPQVESGNVYLPDGAPWNDEYIEEHAKFPNGTHDDQVDSTSQALIDLMDDVATACPGSIEQESWIPA